MRMLANITLCLLAMIGSTAGAEEVRVPLTFTGGYDYGRNDFGRPVVLIAAALGVEPDVFREAFSGVTPARGRGPSREEAQNNKAALMRVLAPHGITNNRLDEVSNYYRFRPDRGERWPTTPAKGYAVIENGTFVRAVILEPGSGYCTPPTVKIAGMPDIELKATLLLSQDLRKNGGIKMVEVVSEP